MCSKIQFAHEMLALSNPDAALNLAEGVLLQNHLLE